MLLDLSFSLVISCGIPTMNSTFVVQVYSTYILVELHRLIIFYVFFWWMHSCDGTILE